VHVYGGAYNYTPMGARGCTLYKTKQYKENRRPLFRGLTY